MAGNMTNTNAQQLKRFVQRVLLVAAPTTDIGNAVIPSLSGMSNAGSEMAQKLHLEVMNFARDYKDWSVANERLREQARKVEASIMAAVTLGVLSEHDGVSLIDEMQALVERR